MARLLDIVKGAEAVAYLQHHMTGITVGVKWQIPSHSSMNYGRQGPKRNTMFDQPFFIGVTGAQGVGKSTFCRNLVAAIRSADLGEIALLDGIRGSIEGMGVPYGSDSTPDTIFAVWTAHLERESSASDTMVVLDRCCIDALAYTRVLNLSSPVERRLFEQVAALAAPRLDLIIHLRLSSFFDDKGGAHETPELRTAVSLEIKTILAGVQTRQLDLDAASDDAVGTSVQVVREMINGR
jgi:hypothetical protein